MTNPLLNIQDYNSFFLAATVIILIVFLSQKTSFFKPYYEIRESVLTINKFPFSTKIIPFNEIKRVTIRHVIDSDDIDYKAITIFGKQKNARIRFEHLRDYSKFVEMIEAKKAIFHFKVIHQETDGNVVTKSK